MDITTSKGTIQGYNGLAAVDRKHQIIVDAQAFGEGQEHHTLQPITESIKERYQRLGIHTNIFKGRYKPIITADTGFANEANMQYVYENGVNAYIPDNQFRTLYKPSLRLSFPSTQSTEPALAPPGKRCG